MLTKSKGYFFIIFFLLCFIVSSCANESDFTAIRVNGEMIFKEEIEEVLDRYNDRSEFVHITKEDVIKSAIEEVLVLQQSAELGIEADESELDMKIEALKNMDQPFYDLAVKQYGSVDKYREALKLRMIYQSIKEQVISDYLANNPIDIELIKEQMVMEGFIQKQNEYDRDENRALSSQFSHEYVRQAGNKYFNEWIQSLVKKAEIEYVYR